MFLMERFKTLYFLRKRPLLNVASPFFLLSYKWNSRASIISSTLLFARLLLGDERIDVN